MNNTPIVHKILGSSKYKSLNEDTVSNVSISLSHNEDKVRSKLHQIWGAYYSTRPNFDKLLRKIKVEELNPKDIVSIHSSTKERTIDFEVMYDYIFSNIGSNLSITDIGCGLNPIFFLIKDYSFKKYLCVDIDRQQQEFLNELFTHFSKENMSAIVGDALLDQFESCDVVFGFKLLPVLDQVDRGMCDNFVKNLECKYLVISFPSKSLGGREKGMVNNYQDLYIPRIKSLGYGLKSQKAFFNESVYIFEKQNRAL